MNTIYINGKSINVQGNNISVINNRVYVDSKEVTDGELSGVVELKFIGDLANLDVDGSLTVKGNIHGNVDVGGSLTCGDIGGDADVGGSVNCKVINGKVDAGGNVNAKYFFNR